MLTHTDANLEGLAATMAGSEQHRRLRDRMDECAGPGVPCPICPARLQAAADAGGVGVLHQRRMTVGTLGRNGPLPCIIRRSRSSSAWDVEGAAASETLILFFAVECIDTSSVVQPAVGALAGQAGSITWPLVHR